MLVAVQRLVKYAIVLYLVTHGLPAAGEIELRDLASVPAEARESNLRTVAGLFNRIMLRDCRRESLAALRNEGLAGIQLGFAALGQAAKKK